MKGILCFLSSFDCRGEHSGYTLKLFICIYMHCGKGRFLTHPMVLSVVDSEASTTALIEHPLVLGRLSI